MSPIVDLPRTAAPAARPLQPFLKIREVLLVIGAFMLVMFAHVVVEGGAHKVIDRTLGLILFGSIAYFVGRAFWRWWKQQPPSIAGMGALAGLGVGVVGWLNVGLATWVVGIDEGNYALILIAPLAMLIGLAVSIAGLLAAGMGVAVVMTAVRHQVSGRIWIVCAGIATVILNLTPIVRLVQIFENP